MGIKINKIKDDNINILMSFDFFNTLKDFFINIKIKNKKVIIPKMPNSDKISI